MIELSDFLILGAILFCISLAGIFLNRKNIIILLSLLLSPASISLYKLPNTQVQHTRRR